MKKSRFTEEQIAFALRQSEGGVPIREVCRKMGVSGQTFFRWKKKFAGMTIKSLAGLLAITCVQMVIAESLTQVSMERARDLAAEAEVLVRAGWSFETDAGGNDARTRAERATRFEHLVSEIASSLPTDAQIDETLGLNDKLLAIGRDRLLHRQEHAEIRRVYIDAPFESAFRGKPTADGSISAPSPHSAHAQPGYRLAWEYELLMPNRRSADGHHFPANFPRVAVTALAAIGDVRSLTSVRCVGEAAFDPRNTETDQIRRLHHMVFDLLTEFRSPQAVAVAAELIPLRNAQLDAWSRATPVSESLLQQQKYTRESFVRSFALVGQARPEVKDAVRSAIDAASAHGLSAEAQAALADIKAAAAEALGSEPPPQP